MENKPTMGNYKLKSCQVMRSHMQENFGITKQTLISEMISYAHNCIRLAGFEYYKIYSTCVASLEELFSILTVIFKYMKGMHLKKNKQTNQINNFTLDNIHIPCS